MTTQTTAKSVHVYRVYIKASPEAIWEAITKPEWTERYGYRGRAEWSEQAPGGAYQSRASEEFQQMGMPEIVVDGEIVVWDPPRQLVQTWRFLWSEEVKAEGPTRLTYDIVPGNAGVTSLTVTHEMENAPLTEHQITGVDPNAGGGWAFILSDLKTLLETGDALPG